MIPGTRIRFKAQIEHRGGSIFSPGTLAYIGEEGEVRGIRRDQPDLKRGYPHMVTFYEVVNFSHNGHAYQPLFLVGIDEIEEIK